PDPISEVHNYGWPCYEGGFVGNQGIPIQQDGYGTLGLCQSLFVEYANDLSAVTAPLYAYRHDQDITGSTDVCPPSPAGEFRTSSAITGLAFYTPGGFPGSYNGALFGADHARNCIWVMFPDAQGHPNPVTMEVFQYPAARPVDLAMGPDGNMYYVAHTGSIRRFRFTGDNTPPAAVIDASITDG